MPNNCNHISDPSVRVNMDSGEKTWLTPPSIINALGHFDTDPCVPDDMPWRTADKMITKNEDGLITPWIGRVWLNPPYGKEAIPFLKKMSHHDGGGYCSHIRTDGQSRVARVGIPFRSFGYVHSQAHQVLQQERRSSGFPRYAVSTYILFAKGHGGTNE